MYKSKEELQAIVKELIANQEAECVEFKEAKEHYEIDKLGKYFSAIANEATLRNKQYGWIIFGIDDKSHEIKGTHYCTDNNFNRVKKQISDNTTDNVSFIEIYETEIDKHRIILFQIPAATGLPINWKGYPYGRVGESLMPLDSYKIEQIRSTANYDWTRRIIKNATIQDLDQQAIYAAREQFKIKNKGKDIASEIDDLTDQEFLNKIKITINGQITNAAMLLLGKNEKDYLIEDYMPKITWKLCDENNVIDYEHFGIPFLLNVEKARNKIRNLRYRYMVGENTLFPNEVDQYDNYTLRELINNCIVHQDYRANGPINIMEYKDRLIITNQGNFIPKNVEAVLKDGFSSPYYRNPYLATAMVNLNMIDTVGSGIKRIFNNQKEKYFPMPDYDLTEQNAVKVTLYGKIIDENYTRILFEKTDLNLEQVILLDRVQKGYELSKEQSDYLKKYNLIEGRYPKIYISSDIAAIVNDRSSYIEKRGLDNKFYMDYIMNYLDQFESATRKEINDFLYPKLPSTLSIEDKRNRVKYLLTILRKEKKIRNIGSDTKSIWIKENTKD